ncbi:MAG TPA: Type 1 glutamine amidotransferase-like domain-containing protein [Candidatus Limnocylindrales bacterium]|nr:Type 1 glutamine amidotransferase-like domain-containing protein [Candidatus Limnocylindrales bacterium]
MAGPVALVGAGEFLPTMAEVDRELLAAISTRRPRVVILPTASWPDGEETFRRWAAMGIAHFSSLGAEVEAVLIRDRRDADDPANVQAVGEADLVYLSGGHPDHLLKALAGSQVWAAVRVANAAGAVLVGCSAGAMSLAGRQVNGLRRLALPVRWEASLAVVPGCAVLPHYDRIPEAVAALVALQAPRGITVVGIDEDTALVGRDGAWWVRGHGRVTVWHGRRRTRYRAHDAVRLAAHPDATAAAAD